MSISTVKYQETFFPKPDLTIILGIPNCDALHQMKLELNSNDLSVHSNLGGVSHGHLGILMTNMKYATLSPVVYVRPVHPGILQISRNATCVASYKLKKFYYNNLQVSHKVRGVEQALIQQAVTAINEQ